MTVVSTLARSLRPALAPAVGACLVGYFVFHMVQGDYGLRTRGHLTQQIAQAQETLAEVRAERIEIERRVLLLSPDRLDPDMLEERARRMLDYAHPDDVIISLRPGLGGAGAGGLSRP